MSYEFRLNLSRFYKQLIINTLRQAKIFIRSFQFLYISLLKISKNCLSQLVSMDYWDKLTLAVAVGCIVP